MPSIIRTFCSSSVGRFHPHLYIHLFRLCVLEVILRLADIEPPVLLPKLIKDQHSVVTGLNVRFLAALGLRAKPHVGYLLIDTRYLAALGTTDEAGSLADVAVNGLRLLGDPDCRGRGDGGREGGWGEEIIEQITIASWYLTTHLINHGKHNSLESTVITATFDCTATSKFSARDTLQ